MRIANRVVFHRAQPKPLRGVVGGLLQPPVVEHQRLGLAVFQEQLAVVSAGKPARDLMTDRIAVEIGAVEQGSSRVHEGSNADCSCRPRELSGVTTRGSGELSKKPVRGP